MQLTLLKYANFSHSRDIDNKNLRQQVKQKYGVAVRRLDNFTLCALAAVAELGGDIHHYKKLSLISCAQHFSIELIQQMLLDLQQNHAIKPLDFVATVGNAANFYIAKEFAIDGCNLFVGADKDALSKSLLLSALETQTDTASAILLLIWQETEQQRSCHALLLAHPQLHSHYTSKQNLKNLNELATMALPAIIDVTL
ncbi:hypothetical protein [uncultured Paraglaciecola sp.]|uniref:hypothetical protein n=1 Tax=uncultured Paraglaciecola sp. TaxID=1765024 RepID=UPI00261E1093|nr:hypothetical protein [uncultured Paraglaciecola sp.]